MSVFELTIKMFFRILERLNIRTQAIFCERLKWELRSEIINCYAYGTLNPKVNKYFTQINISVVSAQYGDYFRLLSKGKYEIYVEAPGYISQVEVVTVKAQRANRSQPSVLPVLVTFAMIPRQIDQTAYMDNLSADRSVEDDEQDYSDVDKEGEASPKGRQEDDDVQNVMDLLKNAPRHGVVPTTSQETDDDEAVKEILKMLQEESGYNSVNEQAEEKTVEKEEGNHERKIPTLAEILPKMKTHKIK